MGDLSDRNLLAALAGRLASARSERDEAQAEVERLQAAVDTAHGAWTNSQYVGGPTEREAYQIAMDALGAVVTQHTADNPEASAAQNQPSGGDDRG